MESVRKVLSRYAADCQPRRIEPLDSAGGMSGALFWRLDTARGILALRRWPIEHPTPDGLRFIHSVLRHVWDRGLRIVPVLVATVEGATFVEEGGYLWELAPWMPGAADYERAPTRPKLRAAMRALAKFHVAAANYPDRFDRAAARRAVSSAVTSRLERLRTLEACELDALGRALDTSVWPEFAAIAREFLSSAKRAPTKAIAELAPLASVELPLQPAIRDIWHDHVLFEADAVTGLIDFGAMKVETPAGDVARLLRSLVGDDQAGWQYGLAAFTDVRKLTSEELAAVAALDRSGMLLAGVNWIRWIYVEGRQFENTEQVISRFEQIAAWVRKQLA